MGLFKDSPSLFGEKTTAELANDARKRRIQRSREEEQVLFEEDTHLVRKWVFQQQMELVKFSEYFFLSQPGPDTMEETRFHDVTSKMMRSPMIAKKMQKDRIILFMSYCILDKAISPCYAFGAKNLYAVGIHFGKDYVISYEQIEDVYVKENCLNICEKGNEKSLCVIMEKGNELDVQCLLFMRQLIFKLKGDDRKSV